MPAQAATPAGRHPKKGPRRQKALFEKNNSPLKSHTAIASEFSTFQILLNPFYYIVYYQENLYVGWGGERRRNRGILYFLFMNGQLTGGRYSLPLRTSHFLKFKFTYELS